MGRYVNPGDYAFRRIAGPDYVEKTNLIGFMNERISGKGSLVCMSRPRRFGKSYAVKMLTAYYDCSCDSRELFSDKVIAESENFDDHLNQYNVILLDVSGFVSEVKKYGGSLDSLKSVPDMIERALWKDLVESGFRPGEGDSLNDFLIRIVEQPCGNPFFYHR